MNVFEICFLGTLICFESIIFKILAFRKLSELKQDINVLEKELKERQENLHNIV